ADSSDVTGLGDLYLIVNILSGGTEISFFTFVQTIDVLNNSLSGFGGCSGGLSNLCYATDATGASSDCYRQTNTANPATSVTASPNGSTISNVGDTVQYSAFSLPNINTDSIVWHIEGGTSVIIDPSTGLAMAQSGGVDTLWVIATAPNSCVSDTLVL